jgi:hypothetical protein
MGGFEHVPDSRIKSTIKNFMHNEDTLVTGDNVEAISEEYSASLKHDDTKGLS